MRLFLFIYVPQSSNSFSTDTFVIKTESIGNSRLTLLVFCSSPNLVCTETSFMSSVELCIVVVMLALNPLLLTLKGCKDMRCRYHSPKGTFPFIISISTSIVVDDPLDDETAVLLSSLAGFAKYNGQSVVRI